MLTMITTFATTTTTKTTKIIVKFDVNNRHSITSYNRWCNRKIFYSPLWRCSSFAQLAVLFGEIESAVYYRSGRSKLL